MVTKEHILNFVLTSDEIKLMIKKAKENVEISYRDNLRNRHPNIRFDCILRGYVGEYSIIKWLAENDIEFEETNYVDEGESIDIDFLYKQKNLELKTSLIPDIDVTIDNAIVNRDIKLIKRKNRIEDLRGDIHMQIYYSQKRKAKDDWLEKQKIDLESEDINYLYESLGAEAYCNSTFFVAWIDKPTLVAKINAMPENQRTWSFCGSKRLFWNCKIKDSEKPSDLIPYLNSL